MRRKSRIRHAQEAAGGTRSAFDVKAFGAKGDGAAKDMPATNHAIEAAEAAGGGTARFPGGNLCYSIHLKSNVR